MFEQAIFDHLFDGLMIVDRRGLLRYANESIRQLCNIPARAVSTQEPANDYIELPEECWTISPEVVDAPVSREVGFVTKTGVMGRAQVFTGATKDGLVFVIVRDVTAEARVHAKYRVQLDANEHIKSECRRLMTSVSVLNRITSEIPPYSDRPGTLSLVASRLKSELGFSEVYFVEEVEESTYEPIFVEKRLEGRVKHFLERTSSELERLRAGDIVRSLRVEGEGITWTIAFRPRLDRSAIMIAFTPQWSEHVDMRSFFEMLALQACLQIDNSKFYFSTMIDPSSGVYNRKFFDSRFAIECVRASDRHCPLSLILVEIDEFGAISERYGSAGGEALLVSIAQILKRRVRGSDFIARIGVQQLAVVLPDISATEASKVAEAMRTCVFRLRRPAVSVRFRPAIGA